MNAAFLQDLGFQTGCTERLIVTRRDGSVAAPDSGGRAARQAPGRDHSKAWIWVTFVWGPYS